MNRAQIVIIAAASYIIVPTLILAEPVSALWTESKQEHKQLGIKDSAQEAVNQR